MSTHLRVLIVEDSASDAGLIARRLQTAGYELRYERVETAEEMKAALAAQDWDLIIADYNLPQFSGPAALQTLKEHGQDLPFIIVSATIGEEKAVTLMKAGAHDYVMKDNLARLVPAVERELHEAAGRRQRWQAEEDLIKSEATLRTVLKGSPSGIGLVVYRVFQWVNDKLLHLTGYAREELIGQNSRMLYFSEGEYKRVGRVTLDQIQKNGWGDVETQWRRKDGSGMEIYVNTVAVEPGDLSAGVVFTAMDITARKRAEVELRQKEEQYRLLVNNIPGCVFKGYADYAVEFFDDKILGITGYAKEEFNAKRLKWSDLIISEDLPNARSIFVQALKGDQHYIREYRIRKQGGEIAWIQERGQILLRPGGKIDYINGIFFDITSSRRMEEERNRLFGLSLDMLCIAGFDGLFKQVNPAWSKTLGWSEAELLSKPWLEFVHPEDYDATRAAGMQLAAGKAVHEFENRYQCLDGSYRWISWNSLPLPQEGSIFAVARDITAHKQAEEALRAAAQKWRTTFDAIGDGVCLLDSGNHILQCNQAMAKFVGRPFSEIVGRQCWEVVHQTLGPIEGCPCMRLKTSKQRESMLLAQDDRWFNITVDPILTEDRVLAGVVHIITEVTQAKKMEQALAESYQKLKAAFSSTVQVLSSTVEIRDPYTAGHQRRVARLAGAIAESLGFSREQLEGMQVLGYLHDIGKIAVPAEILNRPGKISEIEFNIVQAHPQVGHDILKDMEFPWPVAQAVLQHHERLDGSGYPQGLTGTDIILETRILTVADVVEAMASHRPYRAALGVEMALEEITRNKGILYDSEVVEACVRLFAEENFTFD